jgi:copper chaperone CopZ
MKRSTVAQCAQLVRKELKTLYPNIKFSVTSENYSMGDSVNVSYQRELLTEEQHQALNSLLRSKYQYGHFNGMEDIYENSNRNNNIPQTKFLFVDSRG